MVQDVDPRILNSDYKGTCACARLSLCYGAEEFGIIIRNNDTNNERAKDIKSNQSVDKALCCLWDISSRSFCFTGSSRDQFWRQDKGESRPDKGVPESEESSSSTRNFVGIESTWMLPVTKSETVVGWSSAEEDHDSCDDEADDGKNFDRGKPEFGFSEESHSDDVQDQADWLKSVSDRNVYRCSYLGESL